MDKDKSTNDGDGCFALFLILFLIGLIIFLTIKDLLETYMACS